MTAAILAPPRRIEFTTNSEAEARDFVDRAYGTRLQVRSSRDTDWRLAVHELDAGLVRSGLVRLPADLRYTVDGSDLFSIGTVLDGGIGVQRGATTHRWRAGGVYLGNGPAFGYAFDSHDLRVHSVSMPVALLTDVAGSLQRQPRPWRFTDVQARPGTAARWRRTTRFVDELLAESAVATAPLVIGPAARLLAATALATFPNTAVDEPAAADRVDAHPTTLRRAIEFIDANADRDISLTDIARAACVTPRAVQLAFRRHVNTTPAAYLRRVRLAEAHRELRDATPGDCTTVTAVAARWGFTASRFSQHYHAAYGVPPSHTLRS